MQRRRLWSAIIAGAAACAAAAVTGAQTPDTSITYEQGVNRGGSDFRRFVAGAVSDCGRACLGDANCRAFTFVLPNTIQGAQGQCWLKSAVPAPVRHDCCISGVKVVSTPSEIDLPDGQTVEEL